MNPNRPPRLEEPYQATELDPGKQDLLLTGLSDTVCRRILRETAEQALTTNELSARLDIPISTAYRKLKLLCEAAIIQQTCRLEGDGHHATQYRCTLGEVHISLSVSDGALLSVIHTNERDSEPANLGED